MILVDTSIWISHFREANEVLRGLLEAENVAVHPFILGEVSLGHLRNRAAILLELQKLPEALRADDNEVLALIQQRRLAGTGIGYVDAHLLASAALVDELRLWTEDRKLAEQAQLLGVLARVTH